MLTINRHSYALELGALLKGFVPYVKTLLCLSPTPVCHLYRVLTSVAVVIIVAIVTIQLR